MTQRSRYLRTHRLIGNDLEQPEILPRTEHEENRRAARDWLRERSDDDVIDFEGMPDLGV